MDKQKLGIVEVLTDRQARHCAKTHPVNVEL
jgi:hypothetical protein